MPKIILLEFISLDGVLQGPGAPKEDTSGGFKYGGWTVPYFDEFSGEIMTEQMKPPYSLLLGRKTYEIFASYWPDHSPDWPGVNEATKYVVTNTLTSADWQNTEIISGDAVAELKKIKAGEGPNLHVYGSGQLVQTLLQNDLVDEMWLKIYPVTLGQGKRIFADGTIARAFTLTESKVSPSGVIFAKYQRVGEIKTGSF